VILFRSFVGIMGVLSGAVIACRAIAGPLSFPLPVTNPVHPEVWFALSLNVMMFVGSDAGRPCNRENTT
jgi:hypothetical protein